MPQAQWDDIPTERMPITPSSPEEHTMSRHFSNRKATRLRTVVVSTMIAVLALCIGAVPAYATTNSKLHRGTINAPGTFVGSPLTITNPVLLEDGKTATYDASGGDTWTGTLTGTTAYTGHGLLDLTTGETWLTLHETFTGTVEGFGQGQLQFVDYIHGDPSGDFTRNTTSCVAVGASGGLRGMRGGLEFHTTSLVDPDQYGNGTTYGNYSGFLYR